MASTTRRVLVLALNEQPWFDGMYGPLLNSIASKARLDKVEDVGSAVKSLSLRPEPYAILVADEALTLPANNAIWDAVIAYMHRGGTVVITGLFSSMTPPLDMKPFFAKSGLRWASGSYQRTTWKLNKSVVSAANAAKLPASFSQKAVSLKNVDAQDMWYRTDESSAIQSFVFAPVSAHVEGECAVALAKIGAGQLGYVGDVNAEVEARAVVLAMCGLV